MMPRGELTRSDAPVKVLACQAVEIRVPPWAKSGRRDRLIGSIVLQVSSGRRHRAMMGTKERNFQPLPDDI